MWLLVSKIDKTNIANQTGTTVAFITAHLNNKREIEVTNETELVSNICTEKAIQLLQAVYKIHFITGKSKADLFSMLQIKKSDLETEEIISSKALLQEMMKLVNGVEQLRKNIVTHIINNNLSPTHVEGVDIREYVKDNENFPVWRNQKEDGFDESDQTEVHQQFLWELKELLASYKSGVAQYMNTKFFWQFRRLFYWFDYGIDPLIEQMQKDDIKHMRGILVYTKCIKEDFDAHCNLAKEQGAIVEALIDEPNIPKE